MCYVYVPTMRWNKFLLDRITELLYYCSMNTLTNDYQEIIQIQSRGLITIPRRFRADAFEEKSYIRMKKLNGKLILEPVSIIGYPVRKYLSSEVDDFFDLDDKESIKLKKMGILK